MPFQIIEGDILYCRCDAIINPTDEAFSGSGGLDRQIHWAAGPGLREACDEIGRLGIGRAAVTRAYDLGCSAIIHTVAPWWSGRSEDLELLRECYRSALRLALEKELHVLAFPLIGSGTRRFPRETVLEIATREIRCFLTAHEEYDIVLVVHDREEFQPRAALVEGLESYRRRLRWTTEGFSVTVDDYASTAEFPMPSAGFTAPMASAPDLSEASWGDQAPQAPCEERQERPRSWRARRRPGLFSRPPAAAARPSMEAAPKEAQSWPAKPSLVLDESFSQMVLRKIDERGFKKDSECYVRANIDRRLFSKIRSDIHYHPKKTTAVALAVALELPLEEARELLEKAGYTLSRSILFDVIVEYCILQKNYDIFEINELLFQYDQPLLGG